MRWAPLPAGRCPRRATARRAAPWFVGVLLIAAGCEYQEEVAVNADGSGTVTVTARFPAAVQESRLALPLERAALEARLGAGVRLLSYAAASSGGDRVYRFTLAFDRLEALTVLHDDALPQTVRLSRPQGDVRLERELSAPGAEALLALRFVLRVPTRVLDTNGRRRDERTVVWEYAPGALRATGGARMTVRFAGASHYAPDLLTVLIVVVCLLAFGRLLARRRTRGRPR